MTTGWSSWASRRVARSRATSAPASSPVAAAASARSSAASAASSGEPICSNPATADRSRSGVDGDDAGRVVGAGGGERTLDRRRQLDEPVDDRRGTAEPDDVVAQHRLERVRAPLRREPARRAGAPRARRRRPIAPSPTNPAPGRDRCGTGRCSRPRARARRLDRDRGTRPRLSPPRSRAMPTSDSTHRSAPNAPRARASSAYGSLSARAAAASPASSSTRGRANASHDTRPPTTSPAAAAAPAARASSSRPSSVREKIWLNSRIERPGRVRSRSKRSWRSKASSTRTSASSPRPAAASASDRARRTSNRSRGSSVSSSGSVQHERVVDAARHREDRGPVGGEGVHRPRRAEEVRGLVEHRERAVRIGHGVEAIRRTPADDTDPVGLGQLIEVDAGEDRLEPLGFVASEVELGEQLHRPRPAAGGRGTAHEPFGDGVVAFEEGEACRVQHVLPVDRAAGVEPPGDEPDPIVAAAGADGLERLGELATQPPAPERRQLAEEDLGEQRVGERHPGAPPRVADREQPVPLQILEHVVAGERRRGCRARSRRRSRAARPRGGGRRRGRGGARRRDPRTRRSVGAGRRVATRR